MTLAAGELVDRLDAGIAGLLPWFEQHGVLGLLLYGALDALLVVLLLPVIVLAVGAGVLFGIVQGTVLMVVATTTGATLAFFIGRHLLGARLRGWLAGRRRAHALTRALRDGGWWTIAALRVTPLFPFKSTNYVFGALELRLSDFVIGTALGILPLTATAVTLGALAGDVAAALAAQRSPRPLDWFLYGAGLVIAGAALVHLTQRARRLLAETTETVP